MECEFCNIIKKVEKAHIVYEDDVCMAFLNEQPASPGHITIIPKEHHPIIEQVPDQDVGHMFDIANKMSTIAFEVLGAKGTNMIVENGLSAGQSVAHFSINVIPRQENDGNDYQWEAKEATQDSLSEAELMLKDFTKNIGDFEKKKQEPEEIKTEKENIESDDEETDYRIDHLTRIP